MLLPYIATLSAPVSFRLKNKYPYLQPLKWGKGCFLEQTQFPYCLHSHQEIVWGGWFLVKEKNWETFSRKFSISIPLPETYDCNCQPESNSVLNFLTLIAMFLVYKHWRYISFWYSNLPATESWIACIVSTANKPLVGTLMTIGDVTRNIAIGQFQAAPSKENNCYKVGKSVKSQEIWIKCILIFLLAENSRGILFTKRGCKSLTFFFFSSGGFQDTSVSRSPPHSPPPFQFIKTM